MQRLLGDRRVPIPQRRHVVDNPERAARGGDRQAVAVRREIGHRDGRELAAQRLPALAGVARDHEPLLGAEVEQVRALGVLAQDDQVGVRRQRAGERRPGLAVVGGLVEVRPNVVEAVGVDHHIGGPRRPARGLDALDRGPLGRSGRGHFLPGRAVVASDVHQSVVGPRPDLALGERRERDREDGVVDLDPGVVAGDRAAGPLLLLLVVPGQVGADRRPGPAAIARAEKDVGAVIELLRIVRRNGDRRGPLEADPEVLAAVPGGVGGIDRDISGLRRLLVVDGDDAAVFAGVGDPGLDRVVDEVARLAAAGDPPVREHDPFAAQAVGRSGGGALVLHRPADVEGLAMVGVEVVELRDRQARREEGPAAVEGEVDAAVVGDDDPLRVPRVDPGVVQVAVVPAAVDELHRLAAVDRAQQRHLRKPDHVGVRRIDGQDRVIPSALAQGVMTVHPPPVLAAVVGAEESPSSASIRA